MILHVRRVPTLAEAQQEDRVVLPGESGGLVDIEIRAERPWAPGGYRYRVR